MQQLANNKKCFSSFPLTPWYVMLARLAWVTGVICLLAEGVGMGSGQAPSVHFGLCCVS